MQKIWQMSIEEVVSLLKTDTLKGLSDEEAKIRLEKFGPNQLIEKEGPSSISIFFSQFNNFIIWVLIGAVILSGFLKEWIDACAIIAIIIMNGILGFIQEFRAEKALLALKKLASPMTKVIRNGELKIIPSKNLVSGDIIQIESGDNISCDARLFSVSHFQTQEASLTGESIPIEKTSKAFSSETLSLADRKNMIYLGTHTVSGKAKAIVIATGMNTEIGKIAELIKESGQEKTPLQKRLSSMGKWLVYFCFIITFIIFILGIIRGFPFVEMLLVSISFAVAAIPEGLPAIVTITLALGVQKMVKKNALIRKLTSVETLGSTNVICTDKTGTLTQNEMTVKKVWVDDKLFDITGSGYAPIGNILIDDKIIKLESFENLTKLIEIGTFCNDAALIEKNKRWEIIGDPTEGAILSLAGKANIWKTELEKKYSILKEIPFDSHRKMMSVIVKNSKKEIMVLTKGASDVILSHSNWIQNNNNIEILNQENKEKINLINENLANDSLRVLAFGFRYLNTISDKYKIEEIEKDLIFVGMLGMIDPPRPEVKTSLSLCKSAGIKSVMITGDHKNTAIAIAKELNMIEKNHIAITGTELDQMSDEELANKIDKIEIFARVSAEHKLRIIKAWKKKDAIVAMTGDGVNDAPALKEADIGVAMGISGTDVAKEASDMIITDDNFASIVSAVEEGRSIYENIKKFIFYLLSCNIGELFILFFSSLLGWPIPLIPIQILWINLVTDGLPALALGIDKTNSNLMSQPSDQFKETIINKKFITKILILGFLISLFALLIFGYTLFIEKGSLTKARTLVFITLSITQLFHAFNCRSKSLSIFKLGFFTNKSLLWAVLGSSILQIAIIHFEFTKSIFKVESLNFTNWIFVIILSSSILWIIELNKLIKNKRRLAV